VQLGDFTFWSSPVDGSTSATFFDDVVPFDDLIQMDNPATGWLQNCNEPPWTMTFPVMDPTLYPSYFTPVRRVSGFFGTLRYAKGQWVLLITMNT
jgi:acyl-homoserine-lactone acylase